MLHVSPIQDKGQQEKLAEIFHAEYDADAFAYLAADDELDGTVNTLIGFMQFRLGDGFAVVSDLREYEGVDDAEAMQIMARAAFAFIARIGIGEVRVEKAGVDGELMKIMKMEDRGDVWALDLIRYFTTKCGDR